MSGTIGAFLGASTEVEEKKEDITNEIIESTTELELANKNAKFDEASEYVNKNLKEIIDASMESLPDLFRVMADSEDPKFYQVGSVFIKTLSEINKTYYEVNKPNGGVTGKGGKTASGEVGQLSTNGQQQNIQINNSTVQLVNTSDLLDD